MLDSRWAAKVYAPDGGSEKKNMIVEAKTKRSKTKAHEDQFRRLCTAARSIRVGSFVCMDASGQQHTIPVPLDVSTNAIIQLSTCAEMKWLSAFYEGRTHAGRVDKRRLAELASGQGQPGRKRLRCKTRVN